MRSTHAGAAWASVLAALLGLAITACGDDGGDAARTSPEGSPAAYLQQADAICARFRPAPSAESTDPRDLVPVLARDLAGREAVAARLERLDPPGPIAARAAAFLAANRAFVDATRAEVAVARRGDLAAFQDQDVTVSQANAIRARAAAEAGYRRCGQPARGRPVDAAGFLPRDLAARADAICRRATNLVVRTKPASSNVPDVVATYTVTAPAHRQAVTRLARLQVPAAMRARWDDFGDVFERRAAISEELAAAGSDVANTDFERIARRDAPLYEREHDLSRRLGLTICGQSSPVGV